jgi:hypothetical protein
VNAHEQLVVEPGEFEIMVGGSSQSSSLLRAPFRVEGAAFSFENIPGVAR